MIAFRCGQSQKLMLDYCWWLQWPQSAFFQGDMKKLSTPSSRDTFSRALRLLATQITMCMAWTASANLKNSWGWAKVGNHQQDICTYIRATPGFCPGVAAYISTIHKQMILQITVIPMEKVTKVLGTIKQTRSKHPKFLWEKQKQHSIWNSYEKNRKGTRKI